LDEFSHAHIERLTTLQRQRVARQRLDEGDVGAARLIGGLARLQPHQQQQNPPQQQRHQRQQQPQQPNSFDNYWNKRAQSVTQRAETTKLLIESLASKQLIEQKQLDNKILTDKLISIQQQMTQTKTTMPDIYERLKEKYLELLSSM